MKMSRVAAKFKHSKGDEESLSQEILFQSSQLKRHTAGVYGFGGFLTKARNRLVEVIRKNLEDYDCFEVALPIMQPRSVWEASGRWSTYEKSKLMFTFCGRSGEYCLAPTGEEIVLDFVRDNIESYKDLPVNIFQIGNKYRDEMRVRGGLLRSREFLMKDGYSFHATFEDMVREYELMKECYFKIFSDLELDVISVKALSAEMGGKTSEEFMCFSETGEDRVLVNSKRDVALNVEVLQNSEFLEEYRKNNDNFKVEDFEEVNCIELGHIFQLGTFYSERMGGLFVDFDGSRKPYYMGCYGIGVNRTLGAICETKCDEDGLVWPRTVAPYDCVIIYVKECSNEAAKLYGKLKNVGAAVVLHDLNSSFGSKIKDAKLLGFPEIIIVGKKFLENGLFEVESRESSNKEFLSCEEIINKFAV